MKHIIIFCLSDIDECQVNPGPCGSGGRCVNEVNGGFYSCVCDSGYEGNGGDPSTMGLCIIYHSQRVNAWELRPSYHAYYNVGVSVCSFCAPGYN